MMKAILAAIGLLAAGIVNADILHSIGVARGTDDNAIRYIEHHQLLPNRRKLIRYYDPELNLVAWKTLSWKALPQQPDIEQEDLVTNTRIDITVSQTAVTQSVSRDGESQQFTNKLDDNTVVDAGFDEFIRDQWAVLTSTGARSLKFSFAIAGRDGPLAMRIVPRGNNNAGARFTVEPGNWLVRQLVPAIELTYDVSRRLTRFEGFSNIQRQPGQGPTVTVDFQHFSLDRELDAPLPEWIAAFGAQDSSG